jgi:ATP-binding cassette subfamily B (MDR/TAP) protein 10
MKSHSQRLAGQRIVAQLRKNAYTSVLRKDIGWFDLQGQGPLQDPATALARIDAAHPAIEASTVAEGQKHDRQPAPTRAPTPALNDSMQENRVRGTGDVISRLGADASIVGESITRELSEGLR